MIDYASTATKKIGTIVFGLISATLVARYLGPNGRGDYAVIVGFSSILFSILNFGVSNYYARERRDIGSSIAYSYGLYFLLIFVIIFSCGLLWNLSSDGNNLYAMGTILASFSLLRMQTQSVLLVEDLRGATRAAILGAASESSFILICYLFFDKYVVLAVCALVTKELIIFVASWRRLRLYPGERRKIWPIGANLVGGRNVKEIAFAFVLSALITINYKIDAVIMSALDIPAYKIGIYAVGVAIAEYLWILSDIFKDVQVSRTARGSDSQGVVRSVRMAIVLTLAAYLSFIAVGWVVVPFVFGPEFLESYLVTLWMLGATIFMVPCKIIGVYYISIGRFEPYVKTMVAAVFVNVTLNFILIPFLGIYGAVVASIVSYFLAGMCIMVDFGKMSSIKLGEIMVLRKEDVDRIHSSIVRRLNRERE